MNYLEMVQNKCKEHDVTLLLFTPTGSRLHGTSTANSDFDGVGIFLPSHEQLLFQEAPDQINIRSNPENSEDKNTSEDHDIVLYSLSKFIKMLNNGDSVAVSVRFANMNNPELWESGMCYVIDHDGSFDFAYEFLSRLKVPRKISGMIGFAKAQAYKYSEKGNKYTSLKHIVEVLDNHRDKTMGQVESLFSRLPHVLVLETYPVKYQILHTTFDAAANCGWVVDNSLRPLLETFGKRTKEAAENSNIDFKSCAHSIRIFYEIYQLHTNGMFVYPHRPYFVSIIKKVKTGQYTMKEISELLDEWEEKALTAEKESVLDKNAVSYNIKLFKDYMTGIFVYE